MGTAADFTLKVRCPGFRLVTSGCQLRPPRAGSKRRGRSGDSFIFDISRASRFDLIAGFPEAVKKTAVRLYLSRVRERRRLFLQFLYQSRTFVPPPTSPPPPFAVIGASCSVFIAAITFLFAFQHYIVMLGSIVAISTLLVPQMGGNNVCFRPVAILFLPWDRHLPLFMRMPSGALIARMRG